MSDKTVVFGIKNCDSVKKARKWLESKDIEYVFHDFRADGLSKDQLQAWLDRIGPEPLINTRSTTWKQLSDPDKELASGKMASAVVLTNSTLIKRPVLESKGKIIIGFSEGEYEDLF